MIQAKLEVKVQIACNLDLLLPNLLNGHLAAGVKVGRVYVQGCAYPEGSPWVGGLPVLLLHSIEERCYGTLYPNPTAQGVRNGGYDGDTLGDMTPLAIDGVANGGDGEGDPYTLDVYYSRFGVYTPEKGTIMDPRTHIERPWVENPWEVEKKVLGSTKELQHMRRYAWVDAGYVRQVNPETRQVELVHLGEWVPDFLCGMGIVTRREQSDKVARVAWQQARDTYMGTLTVDPHTVCGTV